MNQPDKNSLEQINQELITAAEQERLRQKLQSNYTTLSFTLKEEETRLLDLEKRLKKEHDDYKKLSKKTLTALFYQVLGDKDKQTEKERQEYLAAQLQYDQCKAEIKALKNDLEELSVALEPLKNVEEEYKNIIKKKEDLLVLRNDARSHELVSNSENIVKTKSELKDAQEVVAAGNNVLKELRSVIKYLDNARGWGAWDMMGGGLISTAVKNSKIDKAKKSLHRAQHYLIILNTELKDIPQAQQVLYKYEGFTKFADFFFDGLIIDWIVQSGINRSLKNAQTVYQSVLAIVNDLQSKLIAIAENEQLLLNQRDKLIHSL